MASFVFVVPGMRKLKQLLAFHNEIDIIVLENGTQLRKKQNDKRTGYLLFYPLNSYQESVIRDFFKNTSRYGMNFELVIFIKSTLKRYANWYCFLPG